MEIKREYESIFVVSTKAGDENVKGIVEKFKNLISEKAELKNFNEWGKRTLAYPINYEKEGYYVLLDFESDPSFIKELERIYRITEGVLRALTVLKNDVSEKVNVKQKV